MTLQWNEIGGDGMFAPLPPALGVTQTSNCPFPYDACEYAF